MLAEWKAVAILWLSGTSEGPLKAVLASAMQLANRPKVPWRWLAPQSTYIPPSHAKVYEGVSGRVLDDVLVIDIHNLGTCVEIGYQRSGYSDVTRLHSIYRR